MNERKVSAYQNYLDSEVWKCKKSPTGAHHWVETKTLEDGQRRFQCKHCSKEADFKPPVENGSYVNHR